MYRPTLLDYMKVSLEHPALQFAKIQKKIVMMSRFNNSRGCNPCYDPFQFSNIASRTCRLNYIIVVVRFNPCCKGW